MVTQKAHEHQWATLAGNGGFAATLAPGDTLIILQTTNQAVALWACGPSPNYIPISLSQTRGHLRRLHIKEGDTLVNANKEAMMRVAADSSMGRHDSHLPASLEAEDALKAALEKEEPEIEEKYLCTICFYIVP